MDLDDLPSPGATLRYERTFTVEEVEAFADLSEDRGEHHEMPDEDGHLLVHGLLTATMPTKIGGDLDVLARTMTFDFHRPVYTGQRIVCEVTVETVDRDGDGDGDRAAVEADVVCHCDGDEVVLTGGFEGVVLG
ncbi:hotdog domain-containing protein [Halobaculum gomorrense]|uniref:Thioesterase superfamily protein n=1 Tax=Halobaculum gomorrense TaxID=43928 RepID=A0A1M5S5L8_9EURY|nr:hotdog domain-containing protein [Halobaculum gomorrense]SHH33932.1 Thioesterase superfamily protein [Halobaculum gomorrense]